MSSLHVDFHTNRAHSNIWLGALHRSGGAGGDESEENDSFAVWEGREGGREGREAETGGLSQAAQRRRLHITGARAASYQRSLLAATIRQCRATMCPFITSTATTVGETLVPPHPNPSFHNVKFNVQPFSAGSQFYDWTSDEREDATLVDLQ